MKTLPIQEIITENVDFEIADIFPESWIQRKEFSLYKTKSRLDSALFFVCTDIEVTFLPKEQPAVIAKQGDIVFIPKGSLYHVRVAGNTGMRIDTYTVNFSLFDGGHDEILLSNRISVLTNRQDHLPDVHLKNLFDTFYRTERFGARNLLKTKGEFFLLLDLIVESSSQQKDFYYPIRKGIDAFCEEWNQNERIEKYAGLCGVSETYFYRCFRRWARATPIEYRNMLRLSNAESMLRCTDMKIGEISETVGFEDPFYFCRLFSQKFGVSPQKYRKQIRNR